MGCSPPPERPARLTSDERFAIARSGITVEVDLYNQVDPSVERKLFIPVARFNPHNPGLLRNVSDGYLRSIRFQLSYMRLDGERVDWTEAYNNPEAEYVQYSVGVVQDGHRDDIFNSVRLNDEHIGEYRGMEFYAYDWQNIDSVNDYINDSDQGKIALLERNGIYFIIRCNGVSARVPSSTGQECSYSAFDNKNFVIRYVFDHDQLLNVWDLHTDILDDFLPYLEASSSE